MGNAMNYITKGIGGFYYVKTPDGIKECKARGIFRKSGIKPVAGDWVELSPDGTVIDEIRPRKNVFVRPPIANLDVLFIVASTVQPVPSTLVLDQLAAAAIYKDVQPILDRQIKLNSAISQEGLDNNYGAQIGKTLMHVWGKSVTTRACARAAAGSDARMGGCSMPVVINSGSGNQGMTVSLPVIVFAEEWEVSHEKLCRSLVVSNLIAIHQKYYIGSLSAYCGAVSAACGAGAGITYMYGGTYQQVSLTIINTLGNVGGIVCDGAKPSCAAKIASSVDAALMAFQLSIQNKSFLPGEGIIKDDIEETIKSMGYIGRVGMRLTDTEILNVMIDQADINQDC